MSEATTTLINKAEQVLVSLIDAATQAGEFLKGEIPKVIEELLMFNTVAYAFFTVSAGAIVGAYLTFLRKYWKKEYPRDSEHVVAIFGGAAAAIISFVGLIEGLIPLLKITIAPRVWLLEYASRLVQ